MSDVVFKPPPGHRNSVSCGTCKQWKWGYEGDGICLKYPRYVSTSSGCRNIYDGEYSTMMCDDWEVR